MKGSECKACLSSAPASLLIRSWVPLMSLMLVTAAPGAGGYGAPPIQQQQQEMFGAAPPAAGGPGGGMYGNRPPAMQQQQPPAAMYGGQVQQFGRGPPAGGGGMYGGPGGGHTPAPVSGPGMYGNGGGAGPAYGMGAGPVAHSGEPLRIVPIRALNPYLARWTIKARCSQKGEVRRSELLLQFLQGHCCCKPLLALAATVLCD
jgi:hypothetical protein